MKFRILCLSLMIVNLVSCATPRGNGSLEKKGRHNPVLSLVKPFAPKRWNVFYNHTLYNGDRVAGDCQPNCPLVDVWQYAYKPAGQSRAIVDQKPIASRKEHWKVSSEARIITISHWDGKELFFNGLLDFLESFSYLKKANGIDDKMWGFETFTVRVYVSKRNPTRLASLGPYKDGTPDWQIEKLLDLGCEIAFVDNGLPEAKKDGTFWRFLVAAEEMPEGQRIRYLVRDADWFMSAAEAYAIGEWVHSGLDFHRNHQIVVCLGPLTVTVWGGSHVGKGLYPNLKTMIESFPYRYKYGDDEMFTRDVIWPVMKYSGSVLTHISGRGFLTRIGNPYDGSCEEPTQAYCDNMRPGGKCEDREMPEGMEFPAVEIGMRHPFEQVKAKRHYFDMQLNTPRGQVVRKAFSAG